MDIKDKIEEFGKLPYGWDNGEGYAPKRDVMNKAIEIVDICLVKNLCVNATPLNGGICLTIFKKSDDYFVCVSIYENLTLDYVIEKGKGSKYDIFEYEDGVSLDKLVEILIICH